MKKTQSLKLMLLGLMSLVSTSALAFENDVFLDEGSGLIYQELAGKKAKLIAIGSIDAGTKLITIPTNVYNGFERKNNKPKELSVTQVSDDWYNPGYEIWLVKNGVRQGGEPIELVNALNYDNLTLVIEAKDLETISTKAIQPLNKNIKKFVVTPDAGLTAIPDYAFFNGTLSSSVEDAAIVAANAALQAQINIVKNRVNGFTPNDEDNPTAYYAANGKRVYYLTVEPGSWAAATDANGNRIYVFNDNKNVINAISGAVISGVKAETESAGLLKDADGKVIAVGTGISADDDLVKGYQALYDELQSTITAKNSAIAAAQADYDAAKVIEREKQEALDKAMGMLGLYSTVTQYWTATGATTNVADLIAGGPRKTPAELDATTLTAAEKKAYNDLWDNIPNATYSYKGKTYRYTTNGDDGYDRPNSDDLEQDKVDAQGELEEAQKVDAITDYEALVQELEEAQNKQAAINEFLTADKNTIAALEGQIADPTIAVYTATRDRYGNVINNTVLKVVNLNGTSLIGIGTSAFQNCPDAGFGDGYGGPVSRIPLTTKFIGARAFQNTKIQPVFDNVVDLESIGDYAFAQSGTVNGNFSNATKLKTFGTNVFDDCAIKNLLLKGTPLKAVPGNLAQGLKRVNAKFVDGCGYFYNYDLTNPDDVAALKAKGFDDDYIAAFNGGEALVNVSLTVASLPEGIKDIPDDTYANCVKLATLEGGVPAGVESIGAMAFFRTKIKEFDLTNLSKLSFIGEQAFAGNPTLTTVKLPQGKDLAALSLGKEVFECDGSLKEVTLGDNITCLPAGTFAGNNKIKKLDLSKTKIEVLYNLFATGEEIAYPNQYGEQFKKEFVNTSLEELLLPDREVASDNWTVVTPGLKAIAPYALAYMQGLTKITIPSTVFFMGDGAFYNCANLETVTAMDSHLKTIGFNTFRNCRHLKDFYFVTVSRVDRDGMNADKLKDITNNCGLVNENGEISREFLENQDFFNQYNFFADNAEGTPNVWVTKESKEYLEREFGVVGHTYANLKEFDTYLTLPSGDGKTFSDSYVNSEYGIWIPEDQAEVFTVYQDKTDVVMYKAKHVGGYYKIPAATAYKNISDLLPQIDGDDDDDDDDAIDLDGFDPLFVPVISDYNPTWRNDEKVPYVVEFEGGEVTVTRQNGDDVWSDSYTTDVFETGDYMNIDGQDVDVAGIPYYMPDDYGWLFQYNGDWYYCQACATGEQAKLFAYEEDGYFISEDDTDEYNDDIIDYTEKLDKYLENIQENHDEIVTTMGMHFSKFLPGVNGVYNHPFWYGTYLDWYLDGYSTVADKRLYPSAACIIVAKQAKVSYERHSTPDKMWQSTLDPGSQLRAVGKPIKFEDTTTSSNLWMWAYDKTAHDPHDWYPINKGTIKSGRVVLPLLAGQGMSRLNVIWVNDDAITSVMTPQQYLNSLRDTDAIYNLQGVRVVAPQKGQLYIQNGKKFIQK